MKTKKEKKEEAKPDLCVCGASPIFVKSRPGKMYCCGVCSTRGGWRKTTAEAILSWNTEIAEIRFRKSQR